MSQHVLYITVDSIRADRVGFLGYDLPTTPRLDSLAQKGTVFTRAMASGIPTYFSFKSLLGGVYPLSRSSDLGVPPAVTPLAEAFEQRGYQTAGFNAGNPWLTRSYGYDRGFDTFRDFLSDDGERWSFTDVLHGLQRLVPDSDLIRNVAGRTVRTGCAVTGRVPLEPAERVTDAATTWLETEADPDRPTFMWIHYMDPHYPWVPPQDLLDRFHDGSLSRFELGRLWHAVSYLHGPDSDGSVSESDLTAIDALYDAEVRRTDNAIADLLDVFFSIFRLDESVVGVVGDHGTELADHGNFSHAPRSLYDEVVRVPLALRGGDFSETRIDEPVSLIDLPPTLLDASDPRDRYAVPDSFEGGSLSGDDTSPTITNVTYGFDPARENAAGDEMLSACVDWPWKLIDREETDYRELYNLEADPSERTDLTGDESEVAEELVTAIERHRSWAKRRQRTATERRRVRDRVQRLRRQGVI